MRARSLAHFRRVLASARPLARVLLASARPLARVCYSRVLDRSLARVLEAHGPRPSASARRGKLIRPCTCENNKPSLALRDFAVLLWPSDPPRFLFLLCTRCSGIRALFSEPPCFFSEPAPRYLLRAPCSLLSSSESAPRSLLRAPCSLLSFSESAPRSLLRAPCSLLSSSEPPRFVLRASVLSTLALRASVLSTLALRASVLSILALRASTLSATLRASALCSPRLRALCSRPPSLRNLCYGPPSLRAIYSIPPSLLCAVCSESPCSPLHTK